MNLDSLAFECSEVKRALLIARSVIQVGECCQGRQHRTRGAANLYGQVVVSCGCRGFRSINVQPEAQCGRGSVRRYADLLHDRIRSRRAMTVQPRVPGPRMRRFGAGVVDHPVSRLRCCDRPGAWIGRSIFEPQVAKYLSRGASTSGGIDGQSNIRCMDNTAAVCIYGDIRRTGCRGTGGREG